MTGRTPSDQPNEEHDEGSPMSSETSEQRVKEVLGSVNDLEPPRDDLFVARAITKGRARTARRRSAQLGAAAVVLIAGGLGGTWVISQNLGGASSSAASAKAPAAVAASGNGAPAPAPAPSGERPRPSLGAAATGPPLGAARGRGDDLSSSARDTSRWLQGPLTAQRIAFDALAPTLAARWPDVFSGAYAADAGNTRIVVALVRPDPELESFVTKAMPRASDVQFVTTANSLAAKQKVATEIAASAGVLRSEGVDVTGIRLDGRTDRVVVTTATGSTPGVLEQRYGAALVKVEVATVTPPVKLPNGSTLPTLQP